MVLSPASTKPVKVSVIWITSVRSTLIVEAMFPSSSAAGHNLPVDGNDFEIEVGARDFPALRRLQVRILLEQFERDARFAFADLHLDRARRLCAARREHLNVNDRT